MIEFGVLGPLELGAGGRTVAIGGPQQRRVLAALLVHAGEFVSTDRLLAVLWGDDLPRTALKSLRTYISRLRETLGEDDLLVTRSPGYLLRVAADQVDSGRFERLVAAAGGDAVARPGAALAKLDQALELWRGPAYAEFADAEFARVEATRLEDLRLVALEARFEARLALGHHAEAVGELEAFTVHHPFRERPRAQLMLGLYRSGRQSDALATYQGFRAMLADDLGLEPGPALQALERDILRQSPALDWSPPLAPDRAAPGEDAARPRPAEPGVPLDASSFVGRDDERAAVVAELARARLVTLTGAGGIGKTRLAKEAAVAAAPHYPDGVWWCDLAAVTEARAVESAVATAVGAHETGAATVEEALVTRLGARRLLLVVDNCEHVLDVAVPLVAAIVRRCRQVTVLATSRTRLGVGGELLWPVPPLPVPEPAGDLAAAPAVRLFVDRARAVRPGFHLTDQDLATVAAVCRQLDGLPLAIELAAARMRALNPVDIEQRLGGRFRLLADVRRRPDDRHGTLRAVMDWSYGLLSRNEQHLFDRLSVFAGGFTLPAAEAIAAGRSVAADELLDLLAGLVDHSVVATGPTGGPVRYHLLETLRQYGREHLAQRDELAPLTAAHARYFVAFAEQTAEGLRGRQEAAATAALDRELANLRAAHQHALHTADAALALRLTTALYRYALWRLRDEVFRWAEAAVELPGAVDDPLFPAGCGVAAFGRGLRGDREGARALATRGLAATGDRDPARLYPLEALFHVAMWEGRLDECLRFCREAAALTDDPYELLPSSTAVLALTYSGQLAEAVAVATDMCARAERLGNPTMRALAAYDLGEALMARDPGQAVALFEEAVALGGAVDNQMVVGVAAVSATSLQARHGTPVEALRSFRTVIDHLHRAADWTHLWIGLRSLVELLVRIGADEAAAVLHAAVTGSPTAPPVYGADADRLAGAGRRVERRLGAGGVAAARARAAAMADEQVLEFARSTIDQALARLDPSGRLSHDTVPSVPSVPSDPPVPPEE
jgi:predicted ATPase/DNA-binding SARP family transcriptional activator